MTYVKAWVWTLPCQYKTAYLTCESDKDGVPALFAGRVGVLGDKFVNFLADHGNIDAAGADDLDANVALPGALGEHTEVYSLVHSDPYRLEASSRGANFAGYACWRYLLGHISSHLYF